MPNEKDRLAGWLTDVRGPLVERCGVRKVPCQRLSRGQVFSDNSQCVEIVGRFRQRTPNRCSLYCVEEDFAAWGHPREITVTDGTEFRRFSPTHLPNRNRRPDTVSSRGGILHDSHNLSFLDFSRSQLVTLKFEWEILSTSVGKDRFAVTVHDEDRTKITHFCCFDALGHLVWAKRLSDHTLVSESFEYYRFGQSPVVCFSHYGRRTIVKCQHVLYFLDGDGALLERVEQADTYEETETANAQIGADLINPLLGGGSGSLDEKEPTLFDPRWGSHAFSPSDNTFYVMRDEDICAFGMDNRLLWAINLEGIGYAASLAVKGSGVICAGNYCARIDEAGEVTHKLTLPEGTSDPNCLFSQGSSLYATGGTRVFEIDSDTEEVVAAYPVLHKSRLFRVGQNVFFHEGWGDGVSQERGGHLYALPLAQLGEQPSSISKGEEQRGAGLSSDAGPRLRPRPLSVSAVWRIVGPVPLCYDLDLERGEICYAECINELIVADLALGRKREVILNTSTSICGIGRLPDGESFVLGLSSRRRGLPPESLVIVGAQDEISARTEVRFSQGSIFRLNRRDSFWGDAQMIASPFRSSGAVERIVHTCARIEGSQDSCWRITPVPPDAPMSRFDIAGICFTESGPFSVTGEGAKEDVLECRSQVRRIRSDLTIFDIAHCEECGLLFALLGTKTLGACLPDLTRAWRVTLPRPVVNLHRLRAGVVGAGPKGFVCVGADGRICWEKTGARTASVRNVAPIGSGDLACVAEADNLSTLVSIVDPEGRTVGSHVFEGSEGADVCRVELINQDPFLILLIKSNEIRCYAVTVG